MFLDTNFFKFMVQLYFNINFESPPHFHTFHFNSRLLPVPRCWRQFREEKYGQKCLPSSMKPGLSAFAECSYAGWRLVPSGPRGTGEGWCWKSLPTHTVSLKLRRVVLTQHWFHFWQRKFQLFTREHLECFLERFFFYFENFVYS